MPTHIQEVETAWNSSTTPKVTASFNVLAGDLLVACGMSEVDTTGVAIAGGSLTWTERQQVNVAGYARVYLWTAPVDTAKAMTATFTGDGTLQHHGGLVQTWRDAGASASAKTNVNAAGIGAFLDLTTLVANSAVALFNADFFARTGARAWLTNAGALTETAYTVSGGHYTIYAGYHANAGAAAAYTLGLSTPIDQKHSTVALEIKHDATAGGSGSQRVGRGRGVVQPGTAGIRSVS